MSAAVASRGRRRWTRSLQLAGAVFGAALVVYLVLVARARFRPALVIEWIAGVVIIATAAVAIAWLHAALRGSPETARAIERSVRFLVSEPASPPRVVRLGVGRHVLGTDPDADCRLRSPAAAARHAVIEVAPDGVARILPAGAPDAGSTWVEIDTGAKVTFGTVGVERLRDA